MRPGSSPSWRRSRISTTFRTYTAPRTCRPTPTRSRAEEGSMGFPSAGFPASAWDVGPQMTGPEQPRRILAVILGYYPWELSVIVVHLMILMTVSGKGGDAYKKQLKERRM